MVIDFWTYSCINCLRSLPYLKAWDAKYRKDGLVIIGVHAPEFAFEREPANVAKAIEDLGIRYPVALDNGYSCGARSRTIIGRRITSSMPRAAFASTISARANMRCRSGSSASSSPKPATRPRTRRWREANAVGRRGRRRVRRDRLARNLYRLCPRRPLRLARRAAARRSQRPMRPRRYRSTNGRSRDRGSTASKARDRLRPARRSASASTPATSTSCSARRAASRCASA